MPARLHTGECDMVKGLMGGIAAENRSRGDEKGRGGKVVVSSTVKDLVAGSGICFEGKEIRTLAKILGEWRLFKVC